MKAYNIGDLKNNPSVAIKNAKGEPILILNRDEPEALIFSLDFVDLKDDLGKSLAVKLYSDGAISLGKAAKIAKLSYNDFISLLTNHGVPVIKYKLQDIESDVSTAKEWLQKKKKK